VDGISQIFFVQRPKDPSRQRHLDFVAMFNLEARQVPKFRRAIPPNSEVINAPLLHFKPIFDSPLKKVVRRAPPSVGGALVRLGDSLARVKIWGRSTP